MRPYELILLDNDIVFENRYFNLNLTVKNEAGISDEICLIVC